MYKQIVDKLIKNKIPLPFALFYNPSCPLEFLNKDETDYLYDENNEDFISNYYFSNIKNDEPIPDNVIQALKEAVKYYTIYELCYDWYWQNVCDYDFDEVVLSWITEEDSYIKLTNLYRHYLENIAEK